MKIQYLQEFVLLEQTGNFTQTADKLNTTEATLSRHIKNMEEELKHSLFSRTTRSVELTEFGQEFLAYAKKIVKTWEKCETSLLKQVTIE